MKYWILDSAPISSNATHPKALDYYRFTVKVHLGNLEHP